MKEQRDRYINTIRSNKGAMQKIRESSLKYNKDIQINLKQVYL